MLIFTLDFRRMFRLLGKEHGDRELGVGLVVGDGRAEDVPGGDDPEPCV